MSDQVSNQSIVCKHPHVVSQPVDQEMVLILPKQGKVKVLNEVGSQIWTLLDGQRTVNEIASMIVQEFEVTQQQAEEDTREFLQELLDKGVVILFAGV